MTQIEHMSTKYKPILDFLSIEKNITSWFTETMKNKGFTDLSTEIGTPNDFVKAEKPLKNRRSLPNRVDINILKSKLQETESKEFKKNLLILIVLFTILGILGINLSL